MALPPSGSQVDINAIRNEVNSLGGPVAIINRIQRGATNIPSYSPTPGLVNVPITSVNTSKTMSNYTSSNNIFMGPTGNLSDGGIYLNSATNLQVRGYAPPGYEYVYWEVIEFV